MPEPAQSERTSSLLWWVLGLLGCGIVVLGLGTVLAWRILAPQVEVVRSSGGVEVKTPAGGVNVHREGDDTGLPKYPGAELTEPGATVEIESPVEDLVAVTVARYRSADPVDKVDDWYRERLGGEFEREASGKMERKKAIFGTEVASSDVAYVRDRENLLEAVVLRRKGQGTEIVLVRAGEPEAR
jgi:hypothetical protein